jgi:hypothetical protein
MNQTLNVLDSTGKMIKVEVTSDVYKYVHQLEYAIKFPIRSKI